MAAFQTMHSNTAAASSTSVGALRTLLQGGQMKVDDVPLPNGESEVPSTQDDFEILCHSMERLFKSGRGPMRYKVFDFFSHFETFRFDQYCAKTSFFLRLLSARIASRAYPLRQ